MLLSVLSLAGGVALLARDGLRCQAVGVLPAMVVALLSPSVFANLRTGQAYLFAFGWFALAGHLLAVRRPRAVITAIAVIGTDCGEPAVDRSCDVGGLSLLCP